MRCSHLAIASFTAVLASSLGPARAEPERAAPVRADEARNYEIAPQPARVYVFPAIGRAVGVGASWLVYGLTYPFRGAYALEARHKVVSRVKDVFYNDARTAGVLPTVSYLGGFGFNVGAKAFHSDLFGNSEEIALSASYGGISREKAQLKLELPELGGGRFYVLSRFRYENNPDLLFAGIGNGAGIASMDPRTTDTETRYAQRRSLALVSAGVQFGPPTRRLRLGTTWIHNWRRFDALDSAITGTSIEEVYDTNQVIGFDDGFTLGEGSLDVELDILDTTGMVNHGLVARGYVGGAPQIGDYGFFHWGGELLLYRTLWRASRVLAVRLVHEGVTADAGDLPFTELPRLGGAGLLRGYVRDRFRDELATVATVEYYYPIHANTSGALFLEAGKVARTYDELVGVGATESWHPSFGGGLLFHTSDDIKFRLDVAYGDAIQVYLSTDVLDAFKKRGREL